MQTPPEQPLPDFNFALRGSLMGLAAGGFMVLVGLALMSTMGDPDAEKGFSFSCYLLLGFGVVLCAVTSTPLVALVVKGPRSRVNQAIRLVWRVLGLATIALTLYSLPFAAWPYAASSAVALFCGGALLWDAHKGARAAKQAKADGVEPPSHAVG